MLSSPGVATEEVTAVRSPHTATREKPEQQLRPSTAKKRTGNYNKLLISVIFETTQKTNSEILFNNHCGPITAWEIDGETVETVSDFVFWGSKITTDGDCSHEIKRFLLLGRKVMTSLDNILKSRDITLTTKVHLVRLWFFLWSCMDVRVGL